MTLQDVENAMWGELRTYADANSLRTDRGSVGAFNPHTSDCIVWAFKPVERTNLTIKQVEHKGHCRGRIYVPAGSGPLAALTHATAIQALFLGKTYAGAETLAESWVESVQRDGPSYTVDVVIPWEWYECPTGGGLVLAPTQDDGDIVEAYTMVRTVWRDSVQPNITATTYFDNTPDGEVALPFIMANISTFEPIPLEVGLIRTSGRVLCAIHFPPGTGFTALWSAIGVIVEAYERKRFGNVTFETPTIGQVGRSTLNSWQASIRLPFHYDKEVT